MEDSSARDAVLRHARDLSQQEKTLRSAVDAFRAAHPVLGDAPHEDLLRVRGDISERARVCDELNAAAPAVYAAVARWQVLAHQAPCNAAATAAALDSASGQNAFINAALRIHMETGAVPAPAGDGLGNETDDVCMKCGRAADALSISPEPASVTSGGANCALGAPNQCTCFAGRMYRACADCWSEHTNKMLAANVRRAIAGEELSCCVPCLVCGDMACSFRIKKAVVIVPAAPCAAVPPPPQLLLQQQQQQQRLVVVQTLSTPPPPPPPEVPAWQQPHAFNFEQPVAALLADDGAILVNNADELLAALEKCLIDEDYANKIAANGRKVIEQNQGATKKTVAKISEMLNNSSQTEA